MRTKSSTLAAALVITICAALTVQAAPPAGNPPASRKTAGKAAAPTAAPPVTAPAVSPVSAVPAIPAVPAASAAKTETPAATPISVLERFRTYSGPRTPAALSALFSAPVWAGVRQQPEVVLSNGAIPVNIAATIPATDNTAPNFAFTAARMVSSAQVKRDQWLIVALPETGVMKAGMIVLSNGVTREIPLTVAPTLPAGTDLSEKGFIAFLGGATAAAKPLRDLNGDGSRDYIDDYIFTANYLANKLSPVAERSIDAEESRTDQPPKPGEPDYDQRFRDFQASEAARAAEHKANGEGQGTSPTISSGWGSGATDTSGGYKVTPVGTPGGTPVDEPPGLPNGFPRGTPTGTPTDGTPGIYTITSPTGEKLTYFGPPTPSRLNLRNLGAKGLTNTLKGTK